MTGFDGYIKAPEERQRRETEILRGLNVKYMIINDPDENWNKAYSRIIQACKSEVTSTNAIKKGNKKRIKPRNVLESAIESCDRLPEPAKKILKDKLFFKTSKTKSKDLLGSF